MASKKQDPTSSSEDTSPAGAAAVARLGWMLFGPLGLFLILFDTAARPQWDLGVTDLAFAAILVASIWVRRLDVLKFHGATANGLPATLGDVRIYAVALVALGLSGWALAHSIYLSG